MATYKKINFAETQAGVETRQVLIAMVEDDRYMTDSSYSANAELYPDNLIPFVEKHMNYLRAHPSTDPQHYLANLRLMTRLK